MSMGIRLKSIRTMSGLTQNDLAKRVGVQRSAIQKYESGKVDNVPVKTLEALADALDVSPQDLMGWSDSKLSRRQEIGVTGIRQVFGDEYGDMLIAFNSLNASGRQMALRLISDLALIYQNDQQ